MFIMDLLDDLVFGPLNLISRGEGLLKGLFYRDAGYRLAIPRADKNGKHTLIEVEDILRRYGVAAYAGTHDSRNMYFTVKRRQARWAEYLLLHAGVELVSPTFDHRNPGYAAAHAPGWMPTPWSQRPRGRSAPASPDPSPAQPSASPARRLLDWLDG